MRLVAHRHPGRLERQAGMSLVEVVIGGAILVVLLSTAVVAANGGLGAFRATQDTTDLETRVRRALDRLALELLSSARSELSPNPSGQFGTSELQFSKVVGLTGTTPDFGPPNRIAFEYERRELDDGLDNDGNGLIDDGQLVLTRSVGANERRVVLCHGVRELLEGEEANGADDNGNGIKDEAGFNAHRVDNVLFLRLSLEARGENGPIVRTLETSVRLRN